MGTWGHDNTAQAVKAAHAQQQSIKTGSHTTRTAVVHFCCLDLALVHHCTTALHCVEGTNSQVESPGSAFTATLAPSLRLINCPMCSATHLQCRQLAVCCVHCINGCLLSAQQQVQLALQRRLARLDVGTAGCGFVCIMMVVVASHAGDSLSTQCGRRFNQLPPNSMLSILPAHPHTLPLAPKTTPASKLPTKPTHTHTHL